MPPGGSGVVAARAAEAIGSNGQRNSASVSSTKVRMPRCNKDQVGIGLGASRRGRGVTKFTKRKHMGQRHTTRQPAHLMPLVPIDIAASRYCSRRESFLVSAAYAKGSPPSGLVRVKPEDCESEKRGLRAAPDGLKLRQIRDDRVKVTP